MGLLVLGTKGNVSTQQDNLWVKPLRTISRSRTLAGVGRRSAVGQLGEGLEFWDREMGGFELRGSNIRSGAA